MICVTWTPWLLRIVTENGAFLAPVQRLDRRIGIEDPALAEQRLRAQIEMPLQPRDAAWAAGQPSRALPRCVAPPANLPRHRIRVEVSWVAACALVAAPAATRRGHDAGNSGHQPGGTESPLRVIGCRLNPTLAASAFASSGHDVILACVGQVRRLCFVSCRSDQFYAEAQPHLPLALAAAPDWLGMVARTARNPHPLSRISRAFCRFQSRSAEASRLSCSFLPCASASLSLARPLSLK